MRFLLSFVFVWACHAQVHINACGQGDTGFSGGTCFAAGLPLPAGAPAYLANERGGDFSYQIPVADGSYTVTLHFIENSTAVTAVGQRVFNVSINGGAVLTSLDLAAIAPLNTPVDRTFASITAAGFNGITIAFSTVVRRAVVSAIDVTPVLPPVNPFPGCASDGANGLHCSGSIAAGFGTTFDSAITFNGITYRFPPKVDSAGNPIDSTGKLLVDSGPAACGNLDPAFLATGPTCHQFVWGTP